MLEFMAKRINVQLDRLKQHNENAFMFVDEPGLQFLFSATSGYGDIKAKEDLDNFFSMVNKPRGIHLCGNPDWDFLLDWTWILYRLISTPMQRSSLLTLHRFNGF